MFPPWAPVVMPKDACGGSPSASLSQAPTTSSTSAAAGDVTPLNAVWSQPVVRTSAHVAASSDPPTTKPKYRGPADAISAGSTAVTSSSITVSGATPAAGNGPPNVARKRSTSTSGWTRCSAKASR